MLAEFKGCILQEDYKKAISRDLMRMLPFALIALFSLLLSFILSSTKGIVMIIGAVTVLTLAIGSLSVLVAYALVASRGLRGNKALFNRQAYYRFEQDYFVREVSQGEPLQANYSDLKRAVDYPEMFVLYLSFKDIVVVKKRYLTTGTLMDVSQRLLTVMNKKYKRKF